MTPLSRLRSALDNAYFDSPLARKRTIVDTDDLAALLAVARAAEGMATTLTVNGLPHRPDRPQHRPCSECDALDALRAALAALRETP